MTSGPFLDELLNKEYAIAHPPGSLVVCKKGTIGTLSVNIELLDDISYDFPPDGPSEWNTGRETFAMIIACSHHAYVGRPCSRTHYVLTAEKVGWHKWFPDNLIIVEDPPE